MTTNFRVRVRREHDSDERFTTREQSRILSHISSVRHVYERAPTHEFEERWYSAVLKLFYLRKAQESPFCLASIADVLRASPLAPWGRNA